jgi:glyoxylase-like metal-dependent hydrolase (beta-lactamase superfamily II)
VDDAPIPIDLGDNVFMIDTMLAGHDQITAGYLIAGDRPCLVETGTASSAPTVIAALNRLGLQPADLATVVVTHIHLDHAGGVGHLARAFPAAEIVVHERGAPHLAEPARLLASARRVFGRVLDDVFGLLEPTDNHRIRALGDSGSIDLGGGRRLEAFHAPGHAQHHVGLVDSRTGDLYVGDAAGVFIPETRELRPSTPPPDFDLDLALSSLSRFRGVAPERLLFAHYGPVTDVASTLDRAAEEIRVWVDVVGEANDLGLDLDHAVALIRAKTSPRYPKFEADPELIAKHELFTSDRSNVTGIRRWLEASRIA